MALETEFVELNPQEINFGTRYREDLGDIDELVESIRDKGIIQPISVRRLHGGFHLLAGGRRLTAALSLGLGTIPCVVRTVEDELDLREVELFENLFRKDLTWVEKVKLTERINELYIAKFGALAKWKWSNKKAAAMLGVSASNVDRHLELARAMKIIPELANCETEDEARRKLKSIEKKLVTDQVLKQHREEQQKTYGTLNISRMQLGDGHFQVGDAFSGMESLLEMRKSGTGGGIWNFIECDPPYGIDIADQKRRSDGNDDDTERYTEIDKSKYSAFLRRLCPLLYELASNSCWMVFWYGPTWHTDVKIQLIAAGWDVDPIPGIWYKGYGQTMSPEVRLARTYEPFFICRKGMPKLAKPGRANVFQFSPVPAGRKYHPTQRPVELTQEILSTFVHPGSKILVPFLGSGSTLRAAYKLEMTGYGWDLDEENKKNFLIHLKEDEFFEQQEKLGQQMESA